MVSRAMHQIFSITFSCEGIALKKVEAKAEQENSKGGTMIDDISFVIELLQVKACRTWPRYSPDEWRLSSQTPTTAPPSRSMILTTGVSFLILQLRLDSTIYIAGETDA